MKKIFFFLASILFSSVYGGVVVDIDQGQVKPFPLSILLFQGNSQMEDKLRTVLVNDLERTGFVEVLDSKAYMQPQVGLEETPRFQDWKLINSRGLVVAQAQLEGQFLNVHFKFWDVYEQTVLVDFQFKTEAKNWRRLSHLMANKIYKAITGEEGYFDTRIVYVSEKGPQKNRIKRLAIMDQDGANHHYLTSGDVPVITPRFSPNSQKIVYMSYGAHTKQAKVFQLDLENGKSTVVGSFEGITYAPRFSPDGKKIIMSQAYKGTSSLYEVDLQTQKSKRLTHENVIDTSPSYSPDGSQIVFNSDRGGKKQIYTMNTFGNNIKRISFGGGVYATPVWSPDGEWIAFTKVEGGQFFIGVMKPDGTEERLIAAGFLVEGPTWAPNSRMLLFYNQERWGKDGKGGKARLYTIHISGRHKKLIPTPEDGTDPAWSPPLPFNQN
ncbi:MAG: Tol-Pal system beta propeller repeat protein TolB [Alphaproteobacteria bacterium]